MEFTTIIWLLPIVFMIHDFEEIIMMDSWYKRNKIFLINKYPKIGKKMVSMYENISTASFSLAVLEEFIILSIATFLALQYKIFFLWIACFLAFFVHLFIHLIQWLILKRYIPTIITTLIFLPYCFYCFSIIIDENLYSLLELIFLFFGGIVLLVLNLLLVHKIAAWFEKWLTIFANHKN